MRGRGAPATRVHTYSPGSRHPHHVPNRPPTTKIEFSARNGEARFLLETVPSRIVRPYAKRPPSVQHYLLEPATEQKVLALAGRPETQARDVFDLEMLFRKAPLVTGAIPAAKRAAAAAAAVELPYAAFEDQVVPFLDPAVADLYDEEVWAQTLDFVAEELLR